MFLLNKWRTGGPARCGAIVIFIFAGMACSVVSPDDTPDRRWRVRAVPGPDAFESVYKFERKDLSLTARVVEDDDGIPKFYLQIHNRGTSEITIQAARVRMQDAGGPELEVEFFDPEEERIEKLTILGRESREVEIRRKAGSEEAVPPVVLHLRGIRDAEATGGYEFDLQCEPVPENEEPGALAPRADPAEEKDDRRKIRNRATDRPLPVKK